MHQLTFGLDDVAKINRAWLYKDLKGINTPSVKWQRQREWQRQGPIGMHCDTPKSVPDPFPSINPSVKTSKLLLDAWCSVCLYFNSLSLISSVKLAQSGRYKSLHTKRSQSHRVSGSISTGSTFLLKLFFSSLCKQYKSDNIANFVCYEKTQLSSNPVK